MPTRSNKTSHFNPCTPPLVITRPALRHILCTVGALPPEAGGILLGPIGRDEVTGFHFDTTARCTGGTYSPDCEALIRKLTDDWIPYHLDFKGFVHSHPGAFDRLSSGDVRYIRRLLEINPDMNLFHAPIVIPGQFRLRPIVVLRKQPDTPRHTVLRIL